MESTDRENTLDLDSLAEDMALLDAVLAPIAQSPVDMTDPDWVAKMRAAMPPVVQAGVERAAAATLTALIDEYSTTNDAGRRTIRGLFERYRWFTWGVHFEGPANTADAFRRQLLHLSARDQFPDTRDELLALWQLCREAAGAGVDTAAILAEVAALSSAVDRYGMGSMRYLLANRASS